MPLARIFGKPAAPAAKEPAPQEDQTPAVDLTGLATKDELAALAGRFDSAVERLLEAANAGNRAPVVIERPVERAPEVPLITEAELAEALDDDPKKAAPKINRLIEQKISAAADQIVQTRIKPLEDFGTNSLAALSKRAALTDMPYYKKYQKEIDGHMARLPAELQGNPEAWKTAHDAVAGRHVEELLNERLEEKLRGQREEAQTPTPAATKGVKEEKKVPTLEELAGADGASALRLKGIDEHEFARRLGYESWEAYTKVQEEIDKADV